MPKTPRDAEHRQTDGHATVHDGGGTETASDGAYPMLTDEDLCWGWDGDPRRWVNPHGCREWCSSWHEPVVLIHFPPRRDRWFWMTLSSFETLCPVGSIAIVPRPLRDDECDDLVENHARETGGYLAFAWECYLMLEIGVIGEDGELDVRHTWLVASLRGEWQTYAHGETAADIDRVADEIMADPEWQARMRRRAPSPPQPDCDSTTEAGPPSLDDVFGTLPPCCGPDLTTATGRDQWALGRQDDGPLENAHGDDDGTKAHAPRRQGRRR